MQCNSIKGWTSLFFFEEGTDVFMHTYIIMYMQNLPRFTVCKNYVMYTNKIEAKSRCFMKIF
jgi:hypothetical protein